MAKYCANCGKKLEEGEICNCQKQIETSSIDFGESFNKIINLIKGMFICPSKTMREFKEESNFSLAVILVFIVSLLTGLFAMLVVKTLYEATVSTYTIGSYSVVSTVNIPYFKVFITSFIITIIAYFLQALVLYLINNQIFKVNLNYKNTFNILTTLSIFNFVAIGLSFIGILISIYVAIILIVLAAILSLICLVIASRDILKLNDKNTMYSIVLYLLMLSFISYIVILIFN